MSSDDSITTASTENSSLKQFGLYKTIDARTEEFLRLSRKKQIRQGCTCAAVSTAITVAVIISVLLVYEYNISLQSHRHTKTPSTMDWVNLMNDSSEVTPLKDKHKTKINLDKTTLKILPLLIKTLNQNRYLEKIIEDSPNQSNEKESSEFTYQKNIFSNAKNWVRLPTSRLYTIEYKSSPIIIYKKSTQTSDYFTKIRKIRDYQRMLNYFDKMISGKVGLSYAQPIKREYDNTESPSTKLSTIPMRKCKNAKVVTSAIQKPQPKKKTVPSVENIPRCKCPSKLNGVLTKLLSSIQKLIPELAERKPLNLFSNCLNNSKLEPITAATKVTSKSSKTPKIKLHNILPCLTTTTQVTSTSDNPYINIKGTENDTSEIINNPTSTIRSTTVLDFFVKYKTQQYNYDTLDETTTMKGSIDATVAYDDTIPSTTRPMTQQLFISTTTEKQDISEFIELTTDKNMETSSHRPTNLKVNQSEKFDEVTKYNLDKKLIKSTNNIKHQKVPVFNEDDYEDDVSTTNKNYLSDLFDKLDIQTVELIKTQMVSKNERKFKENTARPNLINNSDVYPTTTLETPSAALRMRGKTQPFIRINKDNLKPHINEEEQLRKQIIRLAKKNYDSNKNSKVDTERDNFSSILNNRQRITKEESHNFKSIQKEHEKFRQKKDENDNIYKTNVSKANKKIDHNEEKMALEDINKTMPEEEFEYINSEQAYRTAKPNAETNKLTTKKYKIASTPQFIKSLKNILEKKHISNPVFRVHRPTYFETHHNDWRQEDHQDYDLNTFD